MIPPPPNYLERVYAGVLGKIIGVYLGRPFEGWTYQKITAELGEIGYYVHEKLGKPLIVTDDDISGTFTFLRALPDYSYDPNLTPAQIGQTWLNYLIEERTVLWWGGLGNSTEQTAYLNLKKGIAAPESGSTRRNSRVVAEQIGAQIFIDGWAMVAPGNPELAASLARRAASVSHDGEAIYAAQVLAVMEAQAFIEPDIQRLLDVGVSFIPKDCLIYRLIGELREQHAREKDWMKTRAWIEGEYGYEKYGGNVHVIPNHAVIILSLLYGDDDFQKSLLIANTSGWDTDCNSGNVGCLLGIKNGLAGVDAGPDWRSPVADRLYLPTADGGRAITDAAAEALHVANTGRALAGLPPLKPKNGARFHFELPGSVQGFRVEKGPEADGVCSIENVPGHSRLGERNLAVRYQDLGTERFARIATATFIPPEAIKMEGYGLQASPTLFPGQTVRAGISADVTNATPVTCRLYLRFYSSGDRLQRIHSPRATLEPGGECQLAWLIPETGGQPIGEIGLEVAIDQTARGTVYLDYLTWDGVPDTTFTRPEGDGQMWRRAWVDGVDLFSPHWPEPFRLIQNEGTGLLIQGGRDWDDYQVSSDVTPHMVQACGLAARVQGMRRYYALLLRRPGVLSLVKALDGEKILAEMDYPWQFGETYQMSLSVRGNRIRANIDELVVFDLEDRERPLENGGIALICTEGRTATSSIVIRPWTTEADNGFLLRIERIRHG